MSAAPHDSPPSPAPEPAPDGLEAMLCFDLYAASRAMTATYRTLLAEHALTYPQYLVLVALWARDDVTIKSLSTTLRLDHATLTPLLRRLEDRGLLTRSRSTGDARSVHVALTPRGSALRYLAPALQRAVASATGLDDVAIADLQAVLRSVTAALEVSRSS